MDAPRIAVVGTGWWAANHHIPSLAAYEGAELVALCDPRTDRAREVAERHGGVRVVADVADLLDLRPDGVVVATPHVTHHEIASAALDAGVAVLVEKPLTTTAADAFDLVARSERRGVPLAVGYTDQYAPVSRLVRDAVQEGIGELVQVIAEFSSGTQGLFAAAEQDDDGEGAAEDQHPGTYGADQGGGQAHTQLTHVMGMVCWMTGVEVAEVAAFTNHRGQEVDVDDAASFRFAGGATGVVTSTGTAGESGGEQHRIRYLGTHGVVDQDMLTGRATWRRGDGVVVELRGPEEEDPPRTWLPARVLADVVAGRTENPAPGRAGAAAAAFVESMLTAARERAVVRVPQLPPRAG
ncbi:Gfo/Idh/MocA family oxidoreductase [Actinotalea ferrariae]|uniref:Gfo/Idh/MocA family protein n=1 Tax=Actinotalea ferrariae TaxID=1386098 RepID=UPI001C8CCFF4|nr:Gfo/Idh/MocA family oxidoreductase [Actinotalea ferrariae]MBX9243531.1 Gfo/Idh/MocA family oxidoreductase [Actinotalea ferrariae]